MCRCMPYSNVQAWSICKWCEDERADRTASKDTIIVKNPRNRLGIPRMETKIFAIVSVNHYYEN